MIEIDYTGGNKSVFTYDGIGHRVIDAETVSGTTTTLHYMWCGDTICQTRTSADVVTRRDYAEGEQNVTTGQLLIYMQDQLGSVRDVIDGTSGALVASFDYGPYGSLTRSSGTVTTDYGYAGLYTHANSGLLLATYRALDPNTGRWINRDPIRERGGINLYGYANGNPLSFADPSGLACTASNMTVSCSTPYGPISFAQPPTWPGTLNGSTPDYHAYTIPVPLNGANANCVMNGITNNPTPGSPSPATSQGTLNNASPAGIQSLFNALDWISSFGNDPGGYNNSPVKSYSVTVNGSPAVVNVTLPHHPLFPGYVLRIINGSKVVNYGEGAGALQGPLSQATGIAGLINGAWNGQTQGIIQKCGCQSH